MPDAEHTLPFPARKGYFWKKIRNVDSYRIIQILHLGKLVRLFVQLPLY
jgi:hypothetical protein